MDLDTTGHRRGGGNRRAADFAALARALQGDDTIARTLGVVCELAVDAIADADEAAVTVARGGHRLCTLAATADPPAVLDRIQGETGQGPGVDVMKGQPRAAWDSSTAAGQWPDFAARVNAETAVRSIVSYRLFVRDDRRGALSLYSAQRAGFSDRDLEAGEIFAAHAALAMRWAADREQAANLRIALRGSRRIGAALGILMSRHTISEDEAFRRVKSASQHTNRKLREVADDIVLTGVLEPSTAAASGASDG